ncbi:MAG: DUF262 domain-containing protein [Bacteroidota bacterium]
MNKEKDYSKDIGAHDRSIEDVLDKQKYLIDYFQREYRWGQNHMLQLIDDLTGAFMDYFDESHARSRVENYNCYYLGPFVVSVKNGRRSIIDGQQRLTSITLLLIYLNNIQKDIPEVNESLSSMIYSEKYGHKSFNLDIPERESCFESLFTKGEYNLSEHDDESTRNMVERYNDIILSFPEELKNGALPYFIDWLKNRVTLVEILAYSDDNAYTIFETMNDRGMNLTSTEMLKGFLLSRLSNDVQRAQANTIWKRAMISLHEYDKNLDQHFFQCLLRAKYAESIRQSKAGSQNEDFERIGTRFHAWVKGNLEKLNLRKSEDFIKFIEKELVFYQRVFIKIQKATKNIIPELESLYYLKKWGIADSIKDVLLLAPISIEDNEEVVNQKLRIVADFLEIFAFRRTINFRRYSQATIRYTMYQLNKEIRNKRPDELKNILSNKVEESAGNLDKFKDFHLHGQNKHFVKLILARMASWLEVEMGMSNSFVKYFEKGQGKPYEVEHIWANQYERHRDEFENQFVFEKARNLFGDLLLIPRGTNQSYGDLSYGEKLPHYLKENILAQSMHADYYERNPNFNTMRTSYDFEFKPYASFRSADVKERQELYKSICEKIWSIDRIRE